MESFLNFCKIVGFIALGFALVTFFYNLLNRTTGHEFVIILWALGILAVLLILGKGGGGES